MFTGRLTISYILLQKNFNACKYVCVNVYTHIPFFTKNGIILYIVFATCFIHLKMCLWGFPGGAVVENLPANAGDTGSSPGLGRSHMPRSN